MTKAYEFRQAARDLEQLHREIAELDIDDERAWKKQLIDLRRRLQTQISSVGALVSKFSEFGVDRETARSFGNRFAAMRSKIALHQADWPAVAIDQKDPLYLESLANVRRANRDFADRIEEMVTIMERALHGSPQ
ncbi:hypothetical protein [Sphingobium sp. CFD-2]|uniref:hypothetical protein n=1 Tax=Sphingobium sp. CFD-2 TaxID=2878542 RepID=UPI00214BE76F|nr:hypothetical protein [Sphingobium sp. CFD-2]